MVVAAQAGQTAGQVRLDGEHALERRAVRLLPEFGDGVPDQRVDGTLTGHGPDGPDSVSTSFPGRVIGSNGLEITPHAPAAR